MLSSTYEKEISNTLLTQNYSSPFHLLSVTGSYVGTSTPFLPLCLQLFFKTLVPYKHPASIPLHEAKLVNLSHPSSYFLPASHPVLSFSSASEAATVTMSVIGLLFLLESKYFIAGTNSTLLSYQSDSLCSEKLHTEINPHTAKATAKTQATLLH